MKFPGMVSGLLIAFVLCALVSCYHEKKVTSHFGHGVYHCYYHHVHTGQFYRGISERKGKAKRLAKAACGGRDCEFASCVFK